MVDIFVKGGPVMIPILLCSILSLAISLERLIYTARCRWDTKDLMERIVASGQQNHWKLCRW